MMMRFLFLLLFSLLISTTLLITIIEKERGELCVVLGLWPIACISPRSLLTRLQGPNRISVSTY